ncbi:MAG: type II secretion system F family protein, partial [Methanobrevibacter sp.]
MNSLENLSLKNIKFKNESKKDNAKSNLFRIDFEKEMKTQEKENERFIKIRMELIKYMSDKRMILTLIVLFIIITYFTALELSGIYLVCILMIYIFIFYYPKMKEKNSYSDLNQELPYALRHMGIELKSGKGLHDTLITIRNGGYGSLSREFNRVLEEVKYGRPTEESLLEMSHRVKSEGLSRTIH